MSDDFEGDYDHSEAPIVWTGSAPPAEIIAQVRADIKAELVDLSKPSDLIFHTVFLTDDFHGPTVTLSGDPDTGGFTASYDEETEWTTLGGDE